MVDWQFQPRDGMLGQNNANNPQSTSLVTSNADGSLLERVEYLQEQLPRIVSKSVTFTAAAYEVSTAVSVFTVSGTVMARAWGVVGTAVEADSGNDGTISLGVEDNVACLIAATTANETNFAAADVWTDNGTAQADTIGATPWVVIANSEQIEINVLTEDITAGTMTIYVEWKPVSSGSSVVAA